MFYKRHFQGFNIENGARFNYYVRLGDYKLGDNNTFVVFFELYLIDVVFTRR